MLELSVSILKKVFLWPEIDKSTSMISAFLPSTVLSLTVIPAFMICISMVIIAQQNGNDNDFILFNSICIVWMIYVEYIRTTYILCFPKTLEYLKQIRSEKFGKLPLLEALVSKQNQTLYVLNAFVILASMSSFLLISITSRFSHCSKIITLFCQIPSQFYDSGLVTDLSFTLYFIFSLYIGYAILSIGSVIAIVLHFIFSLVDIIALKMMHLKKFIFEVDGVLDEHERRDKLKFCIKYHIDILRLITDYNSIYLYVNAIHVAVIPILLSVIVYVMIRKLDMIMWLLFACLSVCIIRFIASGQNIWSLSTSLSYDIYFLKWYDYSPENKQLVFMLLLQSNRSIAIKTPFYVCNKEILLKIFKLTWSYMSIVMNMSNKN